MYLLAHLLMETCFKYIICKYVKQAMRTGFSPKFCYQGWAVQEATIAICALRMEKLLFPLKCPSATSLRMPTIFSYSNQFTWLFLQTGNFHED